MIYVPVSSALDWRQVGGNSRAAGAKSFDREGFSSVRLERQHCIGNHFHGMVYIKDCIVTRYIIFGIE